VTLVQREGVENLYPDLKQFFTEDYLSEETVFVIGDNEKPFVDEAGVIHVNKDFFRYVVSALNEFFRTYQQGVDLKTAFAGLIALLSGEIYGNASQYH
jgi:hypothetical protein